MSPRVGLVPTAELGAELDAVRLLLRTAFDDFTEHDWAHCLGGVHALLHDERVLVGHAALVPRRLWLDGRVLDVGYVEGMAVRPDARRRGHGAALLTALEAWGGARFDLLALSATDDGAALYAARGWAPWEGRTAVLRDSAPLQAELTPEDDGGVFLRAARQAVPEAGPAPLTCDDRPGDPW